MIFLPFQSPIAALSKKLELTPSKNPFQPNLSYPTVSFFCTNRSVLTLLGLPGYSSPICSPSFSTERLPSAPLSQCGNFYCLLFKFFNLVRSHYFPYFPDIWKASKQAQRHLFLAARCTKILKNKQTKHQLPPKTSLSLCSCIYPLF